MIGRVIDVKYDITPHRVLMHAMILSRFYHARTANLAANPGIIKTYARQKFSYRAQGCQERLPDEFHSRGIWVNRIRASAPTARPFHFHLWACVPTSFVDAWKPTTDLFRRTCNSLRKGSSSIQIVVKNKNSLRGIYLMRLIFW